MNIYSPSSPASTSDPPSSSAPVQPSNVSSTSPSTIRRSTRKTSAPLTLSYDPVCAPKLSLALQSDPNALSIEEVMNHDIRDPVWLHLASKSDPDTLSYEEAMTDEDSLEWIKSQGTKATQLEGKNTWEE